MYQRGASRERALVNKLRNSGFIACRSAGSHSYFDVWSYNKKTGEVRLYQLKSRKGARKFMDRILFKSAAVVTGVWRTYA